MKGCGEDGTAEVMIVSGRKTYDMEGTMASFPV